MLIMRPTLQPYTRNIDTKSLLKEDDNKLQVRNVSKIIAKRNSTGLVTCVCKAESPKLVCAKIWWCNFRPPASEPSRTGEWTFVYRRASFHGHISRSILIYYITHTLYYSYHSYILGSQWYIGGWMRSVSLQRTRVVLRRSCPPSMDRIMEIWIGC